MSLHPNVTVGPTVQFRVTDRLAVNVDFLYRRAGYDTGNIVVTQVSEEDDDEESEFISAAFERTRADYWDIPILARYYNKGPVEDGRRVYLTGGLALRTVSGIKTFWETINDEELHDTSIAPTEPTRKNVHGAVVGVGLQLRDEVGLNIEFELRYTRWLGRTFESDPTRSSVNQGEFVLGLGF